jgi:hypothetical protein
VGVTVWDESGMDFKNGCVIARFTLPQNRETANGKRQTANVKQL